MSASDDIRSRLLLIQGAVQECLEALGGVGAVTGSLTLPPGSKACVHANNQLGIGGWRTCFDCGFQWQDKEST
jgi:hypothetical protein